MLIRYSPEALKLYLNKGQYAQAQEFSEIELQETHQRWNSFIKDIPSYTKDVPYYSILNRVILALEDDFNTPEVIVILYAAFKELSVSHSLALAQEILKTAQLLAIIPTNETLNGLHDEWLKGQAIPMHIQLLLDERKKAKENKDYHKSDELRKVLISHGWSIKDGLNGLQEIYKL